MNRGQLVTALRTRLGVPSTDALFTDTVCQDLINAALHAIEVRHDWPWLEGTETIATVNATATYTPTDTTWIRTISLTISGRPPLVRRSIEEMDALLGTTGDPRWYAIYGDQIAVRPVPTSALNMTHRYLKAEADMALDATSPLMPASYHQAIVEMAAHYGFRRSNQLADAGAALADYQSWEQRMLERADRTSDSLGGGDVPAVAAKAPA